MHNTDSTRRCRAVVSVARALAMRVGHGLTEPVADADVGPRSFSTVLWTAAMRVAAVGTAGGAVGDPLAHTHHPPTICWQAHPPTSTPSVDACVSTAGGVAAVTAGCAPQCVRVPPRVRLSPSAPASHSPPASRTAAPLAGGTPTTVNTAPSFVDATTSYLQHRCNASGLESEASEATHVRTAARRTPPKRNRIAAHRRSPAAATCLQEHPPSSTGDATMCRSSNEGGVDPVDGERAGDGPPEPEVLALADPRHRSRGERMRTARLKRESGSVSSVRAPST